jgi:hypothetical protein
MGRKAPGHQSCTCGAACVLHGDIESTNTSTTCMLHPYNEQPLENNACISHHRGPQPAACAYNSSYCRSRYCYMLQLLLQLVQLSQ